MSSASLALLRGLRRERDEAQVTQALNSMFVTDGRFAAEFVRLLVGTLDAEAVEAVPDTLESRAEEVVEKGRLDLHFTSPVGWDLIVELKIYASYGGDQLQRYLDTLSDVNHAYMAAITRTVPHYGEPDKRGDARWLGSVQWRRLLGGLRRLRPADDALAAQWPMFLDVLETEGSMGFTRPDPELFKGFAQMRPVLAHTDTFVEAVRWPLLEALREALGGDDAAADFYRGRGARPVISKSRNGITDVPFRVPAAGSPRVRAGLFAYNPPTRFYVAPQNGRRWATRAGRLGPPAQEAVRFLHSRGFREYDLHSFLELDKERLLSPSLEDDVVNWAHARFIDLRDSGLFEMNVDALGPPEPGEEPTQGDAG